MVDFFQKIMFFRKIESKKNRKKHEKILFNVKIFWKDLLLKSY